MLQGQVVEVARGSLWRNLTKWGAGHPEGRVARPVAIMSAFRNHYSLAVNRQRNRALQQDLAATGLSYFPVIGSGQELQRFFLAFRLIVPSSEESFVIQPRAAMSEDVFLETVERLLNKYEQDFAAVKLPSDPVAFLLFRDGERSELGDTATPRRPDDAFFSELPKGPRTPDAQLSPWEQHGERNLLKMLANWMRGRPDLNQAIPPEKRGGRRFVIRPRQQGETDV